MSRCLCLHWLAANLEQVLGYLETVTVFGKHWEVDVIFERKFKKSMKKEIMGEGTIEIEGDYWNNKVN